MYLHIFYIVLLSSSLHVHGMAWDSDTSLKLYGKFSLRLIASAMFGATFNLATRVGVP